MPPAEDSYAALRRPAFRRFLGGALLNVLSSQVLRLAAFYHLYERTGSAWALALVGLMNYLPILLLSLPAGWAADHFERRKVMGLAQGLQALAAAGLVLVALGEAPGQASWAWYPLLFLAGCGRALNTPAAVSLYPLLLKPGELARAVSWNSANYQLGAILGPILAGALLHWLSLPLVLGFAAAGPLLYICLLPGIRPLRRPPLPAAEPLRAKLLGGFHFVWGEKAMLGALSLDFVAVLFGGVEGILAIFARDYLKCGALGLGLLAAAPFAGSLLMSTLQAHRRPMRRPGRAMLLAVAGFGVCMLAFAGVCRLAQPLPAGSPALDWALAGALLALLLSGLLDQVSVWVRQLLVQLRTPERLRGRVQAVNFLFIGSSNELGEFESGLSAGLLGPLGSVLLGGLAVLGCVAIWRRAFPALRELPALKAKV